MGVTNCQGHNNGSDKSKGFLMAMTSRKGTMSITGRGDLKHARRVVVKAGTSVVSNEDGRFSLTRLSVSSGSS